jgi:hypothetical protein
MAEIEECRKGKSLQSNLPFGSNPAEPAYWKFVCVISKM